MADTTTLLRFKPITSDDLFKGVDKTYSISKVAYGGPYTGNTHGTPNEYLTWNYVERTNEGNPWSTSTDDMKNLFHSFGIARDDENDWFKVFDVVDWYNAKRMIIASIPQSGCGSYIDGTSVVLHVPTGATANDFISFYGSTYNGYPDPDTGRQIAMEYEDGNYGGAFCYLFGSTNNAVTYGNLPTTTFVAGENHPYTGSINGGINPNDGVRGWDSDEEVNGTNYLTAAASKSPHYAATHWNSADGSGDMPYGIAFLEKGIFVIFDMYGRNDIIGNSTTKLSGGTIWSAKTATLSATTSTGSSIILNQSQVNRKMIHFEGSAAPTVASLYYKTVTQGYKMIYFCHAGQNEFNSTSNHTYNQKKAYYKPDDASSLWITEIGLYDDNNSMLAYAKLSEPVEKSKLETITFKVELEL